MLVVSSTLVRVQHTAYQPASDEWVSESQFVFEMAIRTDSDGWVSASNGVSLAHPRWHLMVSYHMQLPKLTRDNGWMSAQNTLCVIAYEHHRRKRMRLVVSCFQRS